MTDVLPQAANADVGGLTCWIMTTGEAGMRSQVTGLAERIGIPYVEKTVTLNAPWRWLPGHLAPFALSGLGAGGDPLTPPWPDLLITCGRRSVALSIAIKKASGGRVFTVHIQDPRVPPKFFDLVAAPRHDGLAGDNVCQTYGALHKVTAQKLAVAAEQFKDRFAGLPRPLAVVLIGGNSKAYRLTAEVAQRIAGQLKRLATQGCGLIVTFSGRTPVEAQTEIRQAIDHPGVMVWDGRGDNPYLGMLALADAVLVTGDSASMVTEATATGHPVYVLELEGGSKKFDAFHKMMQDAGLIRPFAGTLETWSYEPLDETGRVAALVREKLAQARQNG